MTCVPLPRTLFSPVFIPLSQNFCPLRTERFDLRTHSFGRNSCQVSTLTFLGVLLGIICTVLAIPLFWFIWKLLKALWYGLASNYGGWEIVGEDVANGFVERENIWFREGAWSKLWRNQDEHHLPINQSDEQLRGWFGTKRKPSRKEDERRALLDQ
ncbi:hypothetical protein K490DRAFT_62072 [Saccharata proteae CBS 121410]|uniref:Uncharacterized protein n=1 Tax=Saccharata proteae CBS 121410 TaxID=1314787 RepID=A0A9P4HZI1_9PEZI|nr:hypothetical protein K490DRAFT_62072 [Saccharata proteae CBS 121410]